MAVRRDSGGRKCPSPPAEVRTSPALAATPRHLFGRARGLVPPSTLPHTHSEGGGRREPGPWTHSLRAPPLAVPDISRGSLSPLLGGREGDDTRPATFAPRGSRRSGSLPLAGAARCRPDYSRLPRLRLRRRRRRQRRAQRALPPARSAPPCSAFSAARRRRSRHPGVS